MKNLIKVRVTASGPLLKQWYIPYALVGPAILLIAFFAFLPIIWGILLSLQPDHLASRGQFRITALTLDHYIRAFTNPTLWKSIRVTLTYNVASTFLVVMMSIFAAMAISQIGRLASPFQSLLIVPICVAQPVVIIIFRAMLNPMTGIANGILMSIGLPPQGFYESHKQALWVLVYLALWSGMGFWTLVFSAALRNIRKEIIEAAIIDGANAIRRFLSCCLFTILWFLFPPIY
jgi:multiple sugar transport system permease protein